MSNAQGLARSRKGAQKSPAWYVLGLLIWHLFSFSDLGYVARCISSKAFFETALRRFGEPCQYYSHGLDDNISSELQQVSTEEFGFASRVVCRALYQTSQVCVHQRFSSCILLLAPRWAHLSKRFFSPFQLNRRLLCIMKIWNKLSGKMLWMAIS